MRRSGSIILCYHRVAERNPDPFLLCVTPTNFAAHLDELARHCEPSTLAELRLPSRRPRVVVTFDDGYVDNLTAALPIAESKGIPITVFVTSGMLGREQGFWWDRLGALLRSRPPEVREVTLRTDNGDVRVALGARNENDDRQAVRRHLLPLPVPEIHRVLDAVSAEWGTSASPPAGARAMTESELAELAASELVTIGAHTVDHVQLRGRPAGEQQETIASSKAVLERLSGRPVSDFAYPYGTPDSFDDHSVEAVRASGLTTACTTIPGNATPASDAHLLPRRMVMNWNRLRFRAALERWRLVPNH
jgi:peptidoglycan/xylan/chitin deacetylase (PgdA/CDA1 family)